MSEIKLSFRIELSKKSISFADDASRPEQETRAKIRQRRGEELE